MLTRFTPVGTAALLALSPAASAQTPAPPWTGGTTIMPAPSDPASVTAAYQNWKLLSSTDRLSFDAYANFLTRYPDWPDSERMRRTAEAAIDANSWSPGQVVAFFDRLPPLTNTGRAKYALALALGPQRDRAQQVAREAWRGGVLMPDDEARLLGLFGPTFTTADYDARIEALLAQRQTDAAARMLAFASPAKRTVMAARIAMQGRSGEARALIDAAGPLANADPGFLADRARWMRDTGSGVDARALLASRPALSRLPVDPESWYETLLLFAREASNDHQWDTAFRIASRVDDALPPGTDVSVQPLRVRDDYTSLVWLAGQAALYELNRPADAVGMFRRYANGARSPQTITKGHYWAARAARAAGDGATAKAEYAEAARDYDLFYGQLALEALGRPIPATAPVAIPPGLGNPGSSALFQAAEIAGRYGGWQDQSRFLRAIANNAKTEADHRAALGLASYLGRPDLAVMTARNARVNGIESLIAGGFPTVSVPSDAGSDWTMIHAIARQESQFDRQAVSHAGARGLMQLMPGTARETAGRIALSYSPGALTQDTGYNIRLGSAVFERMMDSYGGSYPLAIAAYNAGPGNVNKWLRANGDPRLPGGDIVKWIEEIPIFETKNYVQRVLENAVMYDHLHPDRARMRSATPLSTYLGKRNPG